MTRATLRRAQEVTGRKRHILVDTLGLLLGVSVLPAHIRDRDGARSLLQRVRRRLPFIDRIFADAGYQGPKMAKVAAATGSWCLEISSAPISTVSTLGVRLELAASFGRCHEERLP